MAIDLTAPDWLTEAFALWIERLNLREWEIDTGLAMAPNNDPDCMGLTEQFPDLNFARITLRADVEDNREWQIVIVHELLHVKHSRVDHLLEGVVFPGLEGVTAALAYRQHMESYTHSLAACLVDMVK